MNAQFFSQALEHLGKGHFGRTWPEASILAAAAEVAELSNEAMTAANRRIMFEVSPALFPPLSKIVGVIKEEQQKRNIARSPAEPMSRQANDREFQSRFGAGQTEYVKRAMGIIGMTLDPSVSRDVLIDALGEMEKSYPGIGWDDSRTQEIRRRAQK